LSTVESTVKAFVASDVGHVRLHNEGRCAVSAVDRHPTSWVGDLARDGGWAILCDGLGGHAAGEIASTLAIEVMRPLMGDIQSDADLRDAVNSADEGLRMAMEMRPELSGMGTTLVGALLGPTQTLLFSVGDSRAHVIENGELRQVTRDQATKSGALLQCIGGFQEPAPLYVPIHRVGAQARVMLCTDGLSNLVPHDEIAHLLQNNLENPAAALVDAALEKGAFDNVSVVVLEPGPGRN
jgi:serine/threonine protein phosphatase PrpC